MVKATSVAIGIQTIMKDMGVKHEGAIAVMSDASAAIGIANRIGIGKVRHIEVNQLWLQDKVYRKEVEIVKVATERNLADALTKPVSAEIIKRHVEGIGAEMRKDRHRLAPSVVQSDTLVHEAEE